ncbi:hypothetical protein B296_00005559 [Ensete ventricosum]|uniref:Photosynthesis system II assembly factor Ycf48/Hcf136-like domain-containing protein n=1 Tax=Ensete ventricosum TaxID=4639 RepID=A0A427AXX3_ENSVE|nr:hypothetical protein B296_00005559 [Ensete ventricosum]
MATLQLPHLNQSLLSSSSASPFAAYARKIPGRHSTRRLLPVASLPSGPAHTTRREFIFETAAAPLALAALAGAPAPARSEEPALSEWERVYLPIDPGVVLLDIAFVSDDMNHGPSLPLRLHAGESWERIPLSAELPGDMVYIKATGEKSAEMVTDEGAIYVTSNRGYNWKAAVQETVSATLNRYNFINITEDFEEVPVQSRGFGILDVGYRSKLCITRFVTDDKGFVLGNDGVLLRYLG